MTESERYLARVVAMAMLTSSLSLTTAMAQSAPGSSRVPPSVRFGRTGTTSGQALVLAADFSGGRELVKGVDQTTGLALPNRVSGFGTGVASLDYSAQLGWLDAHASAASIGRYFTARPDQIDVTNYGGAGLRMSMPLAARLTLSGGADASSQPVSAATLFPGLFPTSGASPLPTDFDLATRLGWQMTATADAALTYDLSRRSDIALNYRWYTTRGALRAPGQQNRRAGVAFRHAISRGAAVRLGYGRETATTGGSGGSTTNQDLFDIGLDLGYAGQLSLTRRMTLGLSTGSVLMSDGRTRRFDVVGSATLAYRLSRTWTTSTDYHRGVGFVQTFALPTFTNSLAADIGGQIGQRVAVNARTGVASGRIGLTGTGNPYWAYQSSATASWQLSRIIAMTSGYVYYRYAFDGAMSLPTGLGTDGRRHAVHVGASITLPLIGGRVRRGNAAG